MEYNINYPYFYWEAPDENYMYIVFFMNINSWTSQATKGRAAINWNINFSLIIFSVLGKWDD